MFLSAVHDGAYEKQAPEVLSVNRRMICPSCAKVFAYTRQEPTCVSKFINHVNGCMDPNPSTEPLSAELKPFAALFRIRFHNSPSSLGPPSSDGKGWPTPDALMRDLTPSPSAIIIKEGPWYALRADDADEIVRGGAGADAGAGASAGANAGTHPGLARLYLGSEAAARAPEWLSKNHITTIVNCAFDSESLTASQLTLAGVSGGAIHIDMVDKSEVDGQDAASLIEAGADAIATALGGAPHDGGVLVHCVAGVSRSSSCTIAFLIKYENFTLKEAVEAVKRARPVVMPNEGFWRALCQIEARLTGKETVGVHVVDALHPRDEFPISTHIFGANERS